MYQEKIAKLGSTKCPNTGIHDQIYRACNLFQNVLHASYVFSSLHIKNFSIDLAPFTLLMSSSCESIEGEISEFLPTERRSQFLGRFIFHVCKSFQEQWPLSPKMIRLVHKAFMLQHFASLLLFKAVRTRVKKNGVFVTLNTSSILNCTFLLLPRPKLLYPL